SFSLRAIRCPPSSPLFPYTTLFRSMPDGRADAPAAADRNARPGADGQDGAPGTDAAAAEFVERFASTMATSGLPRMASRVFATRSEEHTSELQSRFDLVCRLLLEKK